MRTQSSISKRQPLRVGKIFPSHSRGDLSSLFRGRELARLREEAFGARHKTDSNGKLRTVNCLRNWRLLSGPPKDCPASSPFGWSRTGLVLGFAVYSIIFLASQTICEKRKHLLAKGFHKYSYRSVLLPTQPPKRRCYEHCDQNQPTNNGRPPFPPRGSVIAVWIYAGLENQKQAVRMIIENQDASYGFATNIDPRRCNDGEDYPSS